jgi:hypothetical protein
MELASWINEKLFGAFPRRDGSDLPRSAGCTRLHSRRLFHRRSAFRDLRGARGVCASLGEDEIETYRDNARAFIASDRYRPFTKQALAELLVEAVEEDLASRT